MLCGYYGSAECGDCVYSCSVWYCMVAALTQGGGLVVSRIDTPLYIPTVQCVLFTFQLAPYIPTVLCCLPESQMAVSSPASAALGSGS